MPALAAFGHRKRASECGINRPGHIPHLRRALPRQSHQLRCTSTDAIGAGGRASNAGCAQVGLCHTQRHAFCAQMLPERAKCNFRPWPEKPPLQERTCFFSKGQKKATLGKMQAVFFDSHNGYWECGQPMVFGAFRA